MTKITTYYPIANNCPYCHSQVVYTNNEEIYGTPKGNGKCYKCTQCDAYVGVYDGTIHPLGRLANKELRELKKQAHRLFDPIWKNGAKTRNKAYEDLASQLGIPLEECHFGWFDKEMIEKAISLLKAEASPPPSPPVPEKEDLRDVIDLMKTIMVFVKSNELKVSFRDLKVMNACVQTLKEGNRISEEQLNQLLKLKEAVHSHVHSYGVERTSNELTFFLYEKGLSPDQISIARNLKPATVINHLITHYKKGDAVDIDAFFQTENESMVLQAMEKTKGREAKSIRSVLPKFVPFAELQAIFAKHDIH